MGIAEQNTNGGWTGCCTGPVLLRVLEALDKLETVRVRIERIFESQQLVSFRTGRDGQTRTRSWGLRRA